MEAKESSEDRIVIEMPSGNLLILDYVGGGVADRIVLHSCDCGDGESPMNLTLIVPDPDSEGCCDHDEDAMDDVNTVYEVCVRHHGPADSGSAEFPADFFEGEDYTDD